MSDFEELFQDNLRRRFFFERDQLIKQALIQYGFDPEDQGFIRSNFQKVSCGEQDGFEHYWYHFGRPDAIRIISLEKISQINMGYSPVAKQMEIGKVSISSRYY